MNVIYRKYLDKFVLVFFNDILVFSKNQEEHEEHIRIVLKLLWENNLFVKRSNYEFFKEKVKYLGHMILENGLEWMDEKVDAVRS